MEQKSLLDAIKFVATNLKNSTLLDLSTAQPALKQIAGTLGMKNSKEALTFVVVFDRYSEGRGTDIRDFANYLDCAALQVIDYKCCFGALKDLDLLDYKDEDDALFDQDVEYIIGNALFEDIINERPIRKLKKIPKPFNQFDFVNLVHKYKEARSRTKINTKKMFDLVKQLEEENSNLPLIQHLKDAVEEIGARAIFYDICFDVMARNDDNESDIGDTLQDIFDQSSTRIEHQAALFNNNHILNTCHLVDILERNVMTLSNDGMKLFFGNYTDKLQKSMLANNRYEFVELIEEIAEKRDFCKRWTHNMNKIMDIEDKNPSINFSNELKKCIKDLNYRFLFYIMANKLSGNGKLIMDRISDYFPKREGLKILLELKDESTPLQMNGLIKVNKSNDMVNRTTLEMTENGKRLFLEEDFELFEEKVSGKNILAHSNIVPKQLFFESTLQRQLNSVTNSLEEANYQQLTARLQEKKLPTGVAVLLYGAPGTGKTESVLQMAKKTGRDIVHVDIAATKSCWFGESEKLIKGVFERYKALCKSSKKKPILLFNEADGVFSKRKDSNSSNMAQTENAIQNIILEEMENLDGILIATTNLADNLDHAFERRFLFKIRFDQPSVEAKQSIWMDKMPALSTEDAARLANQFDFSGGEIDNIVRKAIMDEITTGAPTTYESLTTLCKEEKIGKQGSKIGFM